MNHMRLFLSVLSLVLLLVPVHAQDFDAKYYYRLTNGWQKDKSLDVLNDGVTNNQPILAKSADVGGQLWRITDAGGGYYRLTSGWQKDKSLDVINDGKANNQPRLAKTADLAGQQWKITLTGNGFGDGSFRLTNRWQEGKSLDVINDGKANNRPVLDKTGNVLGQMWMLRKTQIEVGATAAGTRATMKVSSQAFLDGAKIPIKYSGEGDDVSPPLAWNGAPADTQSFVLICEDPDAPSRAKPRPEGPFVHWVIYNIPANIKDLPADVASPKKPSLPAGALQGSNDFEETGYSGPMPPPGSGTHRYFFRIYALDRVLDLDPKVATKKSLLAAMAGHILAEGKLMGTYQVR